MADFHIVTDSSCDLPDHYLRDHNIGMVHYYVSLDGEHYLQEYVDITPAELYQALRREKLSPKTSMPPIGDYTDVFRPIMAAGEDILCICLTSKFSGSIQSSYNAGELLREEFPERTVRVFDSRQCTIGQGVIVMAAAKLKKMGYSLEETIPLLNTMADKSRIIFTVDTLDYLQRGGRIGKVTAMTGSLLNIKPIIFMREGELIPYAKIRGRHRAIQEVINIASKDIGLEKEKYFIGFVSTDCLEDLEILKAGMRDKNGIEPNLPDFTIGTTIGTHIGPTVVGIGYFPKPAGIEELE